MVDQSGNSITQMVRHLMRQPVRWVHRMGTTLGSPVSYTHIAKHALASCRVVVDEVNLKGKHVHLLLWRGGAEKPGWYASSLEIVV